MPVSPSERLFQLHLGNQNNTLPGFQYKPDNIMIYCKQYKLDTGLLLTSCAKNAGTMSAFQLWEKSKTLFSIQARYTLGNGKDLIVLSFKTILIQV